MPVSAPRVSSLSLSAAWLKGQGYHVIRMEWRDSRGQTHDVLGCDMAGFKYDAPPLWIQATLKINWNRQIKALHESDAFWLGAACQEIQVHGWYQDKSGMWWAQRVEATLEAGADKLTLSPMETICLLWNPS